MAPSTCTSVPAATDKGLETTTAQLVAEHMGVDFDEVAVHQGDTAETPYAFGTGGSRSGPVLGAAIRQAALQLREKVAELAAHQLEAAAEDIEIVDSVASVRGTPAQAITMGELARSAYFDLANLPPEWSPASR